jgi:hypothetical protein
MPRRFSLHRWKRLDGRLIYEKFPLHVRREKALVDCG